MLSAASAPEAFRDSLSKLSGLSSLLSFLSSLAIPFPLFQPYHCSERARANCYLYALQTLKSRSLRSGKCCQGHPQSYTKQAPRAIALKPVCLQPVKPSTALLINVTGSQVGTD